MGYSFDYVQELRRKCRRQNLWAPAAFWMEASGQLQACYNGIGPECWAPKFRDWVSRALERFSTAALIHDWEYSLHAGKSYRGFTAANFRFAINGIAESWHGRGTVRYKVVTVCIGFILALLCQLFGWRAYSA